MKTIKLKYIDFWKEFNYKNDIIYQSLILSGRYNVQIVDDPDYLIFSVFGKEHFNYDCIKIFFTGEELCPDFNLCDYAIGFEYMEFADRYFRYPLYFMPQYTNEYNLMHVRDKTQRKTDFCSFVYSNDNADAIRNEFFEKLCKYKKVNSGGRLLNNLGGPVDDKLEFEKKHKFSIAFENCSHSGYTTEKIVQAFAAGTVPVYWGNPLIENEFNSKAFINVQKFDSIEECISYVVEIDNNNEKYQNIINENAVANGWIEKEEINKKLFLFLDNIFSQEYGIAFRRTREGHNKKYTEMMKKRYKVYVIDDYKNKIKRKVKKFLRG